MKLDLEEVRKGKLVHLRELQPHMRLMISRMA